jgi:hypothetical protein
MGDIFLRWALMMFRWAKNFFDGHLIFWLGVGGVAMGV